MNRRDFLKVSLLGGTALVLPSGVIHAVESLSPKQPIDYLKGDAIYAGDRYVRYVGKHSELNRHTLYSGRGKEYTESGLFDYKGIIWETMGIEHPYWGMSLYNNEYSNWNVRIEDKTIYLNHKWITYSPYNPPYSIETSKTRKTHTEPFKYIMEVKGKISIYDVIFENAVS